MDKKTLDKLSSATEKAYNPVRAVRHSLRLKILKFLAEKPGTDVTTIYAHFSIEQSVASQHLGILRGADLVQTKREGKRVFYYTNDIRINSLIQTFSQA